MTGRRACSASGSWTTTGLLLVAAVFGVFLTSAPVLAEEHAEEHAKEQAKEHAGEPDEEIRLLSLWLALRPGRTVADIGAGDGTIAVALANYVAPTGKVYATELDEEERSEIAEAASEAGMTNVEVRAAQVESTGLPPASCDAALVRDVYHHFTAPEAMAKSLFETIKPGGKLVVIDFPPTRWLALWTPEGIPKDRGGHGIAPELVIEELEAAGFQLVDQLDAWPTSNFITKNYGLGFYRP